MLVTCANSQIYVATQVGKHCCKEDLQCVLHRHSFEEVLAPEREHRCAYSGWLLRAKWPKVLHANATREALVALLNRINIASGRHGIGVPSHISLQYES